MQIAGWILIFVMTVVIHEVCHGLAALALGDDTAKRAGRLTLNPLRHIDPFWTVLFPALLFFSTQGRFAIGMAKPVPVDFSRLRPPRQGMFLVALAGPLANFVLAGVLAALWKMTEYELLLYALYFNLGIALFNLIPIPPLDGSRIVTSMLPVKYARLYLKVERGGFWIILALYMTGFLFTVLIPGIDMLCRLLEVPSLSDYLVMLQYSRMMHA